jgi:hypothetical protein
MNPQEGDQSGIYTNEARRERLARYWQPSKKEISKARLWVPPLRKAMVEEPTKNPDRSIEFLKEGKLVLEKALGRPFSKPALAAAAIRNIGIQLQRDASMNFKNRNILAFVFCHDVNTGMLGVAYAIDTAEEVIRRGVDDVVLESELDNKASLPNVGINIPVNQPIEGHLRATTDFVDAAILLKEDQTGFLLVEEAAKRLKGKKSRFRISARFPYGPVRDFITIGADLAEQSYKIHYRLADKIY